MSSDHLITLELDSPHCLAPFGIFLEVGHVGRGNTLNIGLMKSLDRLGFLTSRLKGKDSIGCWPVQLVVQDALF